MEIKNILEAIIYAKQEISKEEKIIGTTRIMGEKGLMGQIVYTSNNKYSITFRKELYRSFTYEDDDGKRKGGLGVARDKGNLYTCLGNNFIPMIVLKDGKIYLYPAELWIKWCEKRKDDSNVIKTDSQRKNKVDSWVYYNLPISLMWNYRKWILK